MDRGRWTVDGNSICQQPPIVIEYECTFCTRASGTAPWEAHNLQISVRLRSPQPFKKSTMPINTKTNIKINGKDYTTDEIIKNVSAFFIPSNNLNDSKAANINLGFKEKLILNAIKNSLKGKNLEGFLNETLVAKISNPDSPSTSPKLLKLVKPQNNPIEIEAENVKNSPTVHGITDNLPAQAGGHTVYDSSNNCKPIQVGNSPQIALLGILLGAGFIAFFVLKFFNFF